MIKITLPDGSVKEFVPDVTPMDAKSISEGFARNVISASLMVQLLKNHNL
jgi:threonyl-tRNA synthetase